MLSADTIQALLAQLTSAQTIIIVLSAQANVDQVASGLALHQALVDLGKTVTIVSPTWPRPDLFANLNGIDQVTHSLGNRNLQVSFPYQEEMVDKVSYHIDDEQQKFHLIIQPRRGAKPLVSNEVEFAYTGAEADVVVTIGVGNPESLDELYLANEDFWSTASIISIHSYETAYGIIRVNVSDAPEGGMSTPTFAESILQMIESLGAAVSPDMATNLLTGVEQGTDSLRSLSATAETFETVAKLLRAGARRMSRRLSSDVVSGAASSFGADSPRSFAEAVAAQRDRRRTLPVDGDELPEEFATTVETDTQDRGEVAHAQEATAAPRQLKPTPRGKNKGLQYQPSQYSESGSGRG